MSTDGNGSVTILPGKPRWMPWTAAAIVLLLIAGTVGIVNARFRPATPQPMASIPTYGPSDPAQRHEWSLIKRSQLATMTPMWLIARCGYPVTNQVKEYASGVGTVPRRYMTYPSANGSLKLVSFAYIEGHWQAPTISEGPDDKYPLASDTDLTRILDMLPCLASTPAK